MRDKLLDRGPEALADYELLEMMLFIALPRVDTKTLAKTLIARFGSYSAVIAAPPDELVTVKGVGESAVATLKVVQLAAQRLARAEVLERPVLSNWDRLMDYLHTVLARERVEQFRVLFLDTRNRLLADEAQAKGTVNHTPVYPREVVKRALHHNAAAVIFAHNHPSGVAEVLPHEPLHAEQPVARLQPAGRGEPHLLVAGEFVGRLACREMQVVANPHQKLAGIAEGIGVGP
jgi:DNA repair protein RadC